ncbi:MAG: amino acid adenylation domain-containing protein, partial [Longimicrobiaceae bacterium]
MVPVERTGSLPLSFAQQRLWFIQQLDPAGSAYNLPYPLRLRGALDLSVLRASLDALVRRHESLRTTFSEEDGKPVQVVHPPVRVPLPGVDLSGLPAEARQAEAKRLVGAESMRPFDLARGPLLRGTLVRLDGEDHVLLFNMHHIVSDGWSMQVLVREVSVFYGAFSRGEEPKLPELPVQYADFAVWQREWLSGDVLEAQIAYWRERLAGAPPLLEIPTDRPRRAVQNPLAATHHFALPPELSQQLRELGRREGGTLFMTLLAAWQALLGRWAGQDDVVVGTPIAGRTRKETEGLIGFFVNTLALRAHMEADPTWTELLGQVREETLGAYDHQALPFERLVEELGVERSLTHTPVFQAAFTLNLFAGKSGERLELGQLALEQFGGGKGAAKADLDLVFTDSGEKLGAMVIYRRALFDAGTISRLSGHLAATLEAMAADPRRRLSELSLLGGAERAQLLEAWTDTARPYPERCLHELFGEQAARTPGAVAVVADGREVTYAELESGANRLAHRLRALGVGPEVRVGVALERGAGLVVALLGTLRAGGVYLPLDPAHPGERMAYMLADSGASVLLAPAAVQDSVPSFGGARVCLDADREAIAGEPDTAPESGVDPQNAAYVIYTSGSTGRPKGVVVAHRSAVNLLAGALETIGAGPGSRVLHVASIGFDASLLEIFVALLAGAQLHVADRETVLAPERLGALLKEREIDVMVTIPVLLDRLPAAEFPALLTVCMGGDRCSGETAALWSSGRRLLNMYGPTETTIYTTAHLCAPGAAETPPIGRPVPNARAYVLDAWGEPAPVGMPGELYMGGPGVARGYLGRPELTAERFVPDPFAGEPGERLYRTGDRARWRADGELEFLGRTDAQVKIRGMRIEPGEVEGVLAGLPQVREAAVVVREDKPGDKRLVAYVVPQEGEELSTAELRAGLAERLPEYMVPGAFVTLEKLPLGVSGKVDRRALPAPERGGALAAYIAPRTPVEEVLAEIWAEVLKTERVGAGDNFFELGGHSLLATQVISRLRQAFGVEVPLKALFEAPTVAGLAARVEELRSAGAAPVLPMVPVERTGPLPLSFAQQRLWVVDRIEPGSAAYNMPYPLRLRGVLELPVLRASLDALVRRHESLRTTFSEEDGRPVQVVHPAARVPLPTVDLTGLPADARQPEAKRLSGAEAMRPFDLAAGPLLRGTLLRLDGEDHVLLFNMHHIVSDGWSMQVLVREVSVIYAASSRGEEPKLPELPVQYADFSVWQREWLSGDVLEAQLAYWKERLAGAPALLEIPTDRPRRAGQSPRASRHPFALSPELSQRLRELARREGGTLFMTLLAAWQALLGRYAGQDDVVVGTPIAGRNRKETEGLIGFFVNTLALRARLTADPTWTELLGQVREETLGAYDHQDLPFERLVEELGVERSLTHSPVFQAIFTLNHVGGRGGQGAQGAQGGDRLELGGLGLEPFGGGETAAKFDLDLVVGDGGEGLGGGLLYRRTLFEAATIARMVGHLETLLRSMADDPSRRLAEVSLLSDDERAQVLEAWNPAAPELPAGSVHELFAQQAALTPDAVAIASRGEPLTYAALRRRAGRLARRLRREGAGPERVVGIFMEHSADVVVALLGTLEAGGCCLLLDPEHPQARVAALLEDAGVRLVVAQPHLRDRLPAGSAELRVVELDGTDTDSGGEELPRVAPESAAYLVYTSGSTGRPKGVLVSHAAAATHLREIGRAYGLTAADRVLVFAAQSFDPFLEQALAPLLAGASVTLRDPVVWTPAEFVEQVQGRGVTVANVAPAYWMQLVRERVTVAALKQALRLMVVGGEALAPPTVRAWDESGEGAGRLLNAYGPTEAVVTATLYETTVEDWGAWGGSVPIGRAVPGRRTYVLDGRGEPVPVGVPGELCLGGTALARGYLGQAEQTAARFVPDALGGEAGARLY